MRGREGFGFGAICGGLLLATLAGGSAWAQAARLDAVARMLSRNEQELSHYRWKTRTEIRVADELQRITLVQASYAPDGTLVEVPLPDGEAGPSRKKLKKKVLAFYEELQTLTRSYIELEPRRIEAALARAHAWEGQGERGDLLHVQARGVIRQADRLDLWLDNLTDRPRRLEVLTSLQGEPVRLTTTFARVPDGPSYASETLVETELKEKEMTVRTESFDHVRRKD